MRSTASPNKRCSWVNVDDPLLLEYHDREWGVPVHSDHKHFEVLVLSSAQAGLNWSLVLKKREGYRRAFDRFDPERVARYSEKQRRALLADPKIIRNRVKIAAAARHARALLKIQEEFRGVLLFPLGVRCRGHQTRRKTSILHHTIAIPP